MPELSDVDMTWPVVASTDIYSGYAINVRRDTLRATDGSTFDRDVVAHSGAVGVVAIDDRDRLLVVTQYRHAPRMRLVELPAGLLDNPGEDRLEGAQRELAEEGQVKAERWSLLLEMLLSPGISDELITLYLAEDVSAADVPVGFVAAHEEATMTRRWVPLGDVVAAVLAGRVHNAALVAGALAAWVRRMPGSGSAGQAARATGSAE